MNRRLFGFILIIPLILGLFRLRFDADIFNLLPSSLPAVRGLQLQQRNFANARELIVTVSGGDPEAVSAAAAAIAGHLGALTNLVRAARWQPPWLDRPSDAAQNLGWLWLQQPPNQFMELAARLTPEGARAEFAASREALATSLDPQEVARRSYDPLGFTRLPGNSALSAGFDAGTGIFSNADGDYRVVFVEPANDRLSYREAAAWLVDVRKEVESAFAGVRNPAGSVQIAYTGGPAFLAEISTGMESDLRSSVFTTVAVIAALFWLAHRTWRPLGWLIAALLLTLMITLALGGLVFGTLNVVSLGFAAVLLGLAVDYGLVGYQEFVAHPDRSLGEIRREVGPGIWYSAGTTAGTFALLGLAGLPGLAQLGVLTAMGLVAGAGVMLFIYLPIVTRARPVSRGGRLRFPLERLQKSAWPSVAAIAFILGTLVWKGLPAVSGSADPLRPRVSPAYDAMDRLKERFGRTNDPMWMVIEGPDEATVADRLAAAQASLAAALARQEIISYTLPSDFWPRPRNAQTNGSIASQLAARRDEIHRAAAAAGFTTDSLSLADSVFDTWDSVKLSDAARWPTNTTAQWLVSQFAARTSDSRWLALGIVQPGRKPVSADFTKSLPPGVWLTSWETLGAALLSHVSHRVILVTLLIAIMLVGSLWMAFRNVRELGLSFGALALSFGLLLAIMSLLGWSWNLLSLVALPLLLGSSVDSTIHVQLALRRHGSDFAGLWRSTGKALLLCAGSNIAGFGSLAFTNNEGLASLDLVCAIGVACVFGVCMGLLPAWWRKSGGAPKISSTLYRASCWRAGLWVGRSLPEAALIRMARLGAIAYRRFKPERFEVVVGNLLPVFGGNRGMARRVAADNFAHFSRKIADLWRWEAGARIDEDLEFGGGREYFVGAADSGRGVLLVTMHLGNWEFGASLLARNGKRPLVLTAREPSRELTEIRAAARARRGIDTLVVGDDPFAFVEVIKRLQAGGLVAILLDRPAAATAVEVKFLGKPFKASVAAAELARASGCVVLPVYIVYEAAGYRAHACAPIEYDRSQLGDRAARKALTERILNGFEPVVRQYASQWYHFVPMWEPGAMEATNQDHS